MSLGISLQEAARLMCVEDRTVRNWVRRVGIQTIPDGADGRRRLITDDDLKSLADRFRRPLASLPQAAYRDANSSRRANIETPPTSTDSQEGAPAHDAPTPGSVAQSSDEELQRVLKALDLLTSEVSEMRAKVDLLVKTTLSPNATPERAQPADDTSGEMRPLRHTNEIVRADG